MNVIGQSLLQSNSTQYRKKNRMSILTAASMTADTPFSTDSTIPPCHITGQNKPIAKIPVVIRKAMMYAIGPLFIIFTSP